MKVFFEDVDVSTRNRTELFDITKSVEEVTRKSGVTSEICIIHSVHSTTAIIVNVNEAGLVKYTARKIQREFLRGAGWEYDRIDDNAAAHLASSFIGPARIFPVKWGRPC